MSTFGPRQPKHSTPDLVRFVVVVAPLLVTFFAVEWHSSGDLSASARPDTFQQAREFLQRGDDE